MLNTLWTVLLLAGIGWGTLTGNARATGEALLEGAASGVSLCMTMFGVLALLEQGFWKLRQLPG